VKTPQHTTLNLQPNVSYTMFVTNYETRGNVQVK